MKKRQLINEIMGVPKAIDEWVNYLATVTAILVNEIIEEDKFEGRTFEWEDGEDHPMYEGSKKISGRNFMLLMSDTFYGGDVKNFLTSEMFKEFPLYNPEIEVALILLPDEIYEKGNFSDRMAATHTYVGEISNVKLGKLGKSTIFGKNKFIFKVVLPFSYVENRTKEVEKNFHNALIPTVAHELTHSYQTYRQMLGGKKSIGFGKETILNMLPQQMKFTETPSWNDFLHLVYLSLSFEVNARVTELYYDLKRKKPKSKDEALKFLMASPPWDDYRQLKDFNAEKFISEFDAELYEKDPLHDLFSMFMGKKAPKLPETNEEWFDLLINRWDGLIQNAQKQMKELEIDVPFMENVPESAKRNPIKFFKFFEKRFHKKADGLRRKLAKVVSLVVNEMEPIKEGEELFGDNRWDE
jgi:hypothetical protein